MLEEHCDDLDAACEAGDIERLEAAVGRLWEAVQDAADPTELTAAVRRLCTPIEGLTAGVGGQLAVLAGALVERGADATSLAGPVRGQFNLVDAVGKWIWNEGRPADIPAVDGQRIVVLDPPSYPRTWNIGRVYPMMSPGISLDRVLAADEAAAWHGVHGA